jgi:hypothetical protein
VSDLKQPLSGDDARGPFLFAVNTKEFPGKMKLTFLRFETQVVDASAFLDGRYTLLDPSSPEARLLATVLAFRGDGAGGG